MKNSYYIPRIESMNSTTEIFEINHYRRSRLTTIYPPTHSFAKIQQKLLCPLVWEITRYGSFSWTLPNTSLKFCIMLRKDARLHIATRGQDAPRLYGWSCALTCNHTTEYKPLGHTAHVNDLLAQRHTHSGKCIGPSKRATCTVYIEHFPSTMIDMRYKTNWQVF